MNSPKIQVIVLNALVLLLLLSFQGAHAAGLTSANGPVLLRCPCGGGGGGRGGGGGGGGGQLTPDEIDGLNYMREEEKLARDAYWTLYAQWGLPIFSKISNSEVMHMSKVKDLLDRYGLPDPAAGKAVGEFSNPVLQQLFDDLIIQGSLSSTDALKVGVTIEEVDIADLQRYLAATNKSDIINVYTNLMNASYMHLNAFENQLGH